MMRYSATTAAIVRDARKALEGSCKFFVVSLDDYDSRTPNEVFGALAKLVGDLIRERTLRGVVTIANGDRHSIWVYANPAPQELMFLVSQNVR